MLHQLFPEKADNGDENVNSQYTNLILALLRSLPNVFKFEIQDTELPIYMNIYVLSLTFIGPKRLFYKF